MYNYNKNRKSDDEDEDENRSARGTVNRSPSNKPIGSKYDRKQNDSDDDEDDRKAYSQKPDFKRSTASSVKPVSSKPPTGRSVQSPINKWSSKNDRLSPNRSDDDDDDAYEKINVNQRGKYAKPTSNMSDDEDDNKRTKKIYKQQDSDDDDDDNEESKKPIAKSNSTRYVPKQRDSDNSDDADDQKSRNLSRGIKQVKKYGSDEEDNVNQNKRGVNSFESKNRFSSARKSDSDEEKKDFGTKTRFADYSKKSSSFGDDDDEEKKPTSSRALAKYGLTSLKLGSTDNDQDKDKRSKNDLLGRYAVQQDDDEKLKKFSYDKLKSDSLSNRSIELDKKHQPAERYDLTYSNSKYSTNNTNSNSNNNKPKSILKKDSNSDNEEGDDDKLSEFEKFKRNNRIESLSPASKIASSSSPMAHNSKLVKNVGPLDTLSKKKLLETNDKNSNTKGHDDFPAHSYDLNGSSSLQRPNPSVFLQNKTTSLDRLNTQSAYNSQRIGGLVDTNKFDIKKYSSVNNLNHFETMSDRSTTSLNMTNLTIKEAKSKSYLVGSSNSIGGKGLLSAYELDKNLNDRKARVLVITWNMNEMKKFSENLEELVLPDNIETMPDLYAIGCQEFSMSQKDWEIKLQELIGPTHVKFASYYYGSLCLNLFIRRELVWFCSVVDFEAINLKNAVKSPIRTKASILATFQLFGTLMCFICSHFEAGDEKLEQRIENYKTTINNVTLPKSIKRPVSGSGKDNQSISNFDCVFWFGDLNFRITKERDKVVKKVFDVKDKKSSNYEDVLQHDELSKVLHNNAAFDGFIEPKIMFEPTYKYDVNTDEYDTSTKCRIPSYCDRILYKSKTKNRILCSHYDLIKPLKSSDHRAVYALLEVQIKPGVDKVPLLFGNFDREVFINGYKKRQMHNAYNIGFNNFMVKRESSKKEKTKSPFNSMCPIQ